MISKSCSANRESIWAIKHFGRNLSQKNAFLWPNKALWRISDLRPKSGLRELILEQISFLEKERGEKGEES